MDHSKPSDMIFESQRWTIEQAEIREEKTWK